MFFMIVFDFGMAFGISVILKICTGDAGIASDMINVGLRCKVIFISFLSCFS